jgi:MFS-type transporter involved in bile tolerance (Atg22 family)
LEKFTIVEYGKRKFWVIVSMVFGGVTLMVSSFYTDEQYADLFAVLCILAQVCMAFLDIVAHSLMVK